MYGCIVIFIYSFISFHSKWFLNFCIWISNWILYWKLEDRDHSLLRSAKKWSIFRPPHLPGPLLLELKWHHHPIVANDHPNLRLSNPPPFFIHPPCVSLDFSRFKCLLVTKIKNFNNSIADLGYFSSTFLQSVIGSKNSILN